MMARTTHLYHHAKFGGNRTTHLGVRVQSVMFFTFFVNNTQITVAGDSRITSTRDCVGIYRPFRWGLRRFFREEKHFPADRTNLKIVARWRYDWCANG